MTLQKVLKLKQEIEKEIYRDLEKKARNANLFINYIFQKNDQI